MSFSSAENRLSTNTDRNTTSFKNGPNPEIQHLKFWIRFGGKFNFLENIKFKLPIFESLAKSNLPISKKVPHRPRHLIDACNCSSANEFKTKSTPSPFVRSLIMSSNEQSRELPIFSSVAKQEFSLNFVAFQRTWRTDTKRWLGLPFNWGNVSIMNFFLAGVDTVVNTSKPYAKATRMAAMYM